MIAFLTSKLAGPIFGGACLALLVLLATAQLRFMDMRGQRDDYRAGLADAETRLAQARTNSAQYQSGLTACNVSVAEMQARAEAAEGRVAALLAQAAPRSDAETARAEAVRTATWAGADECARVDSVLDGLFGE